MGQTSIPEFSELLYTFEVKGSALAPTFQKGDVLYCQKLENRTQVDKDQFFILETEFGQYLTKLEPVDDVSGEMIAYKLCSIKNDNNESVIISTERIKDILIVRFRMDNLLL